MRVKKVNYLKALVLGSIVSILTIFYFLFLSRTFETNGFVIMSGVISSPLLGGFLAGYILKEKVWESLGIGILIGLLSSVSFIIYTAFLSILIFVLPLTIVLGAISSIGGGKISQGVSKKDFYDYSKSFVVALIISVPLGYPLGLILFTPMFAGLLAGSMLNRGVWKGLGIGFLASGSNIAVTIILVKTFEAPGPASTSIGFFGAISPLLLLSGVIGGALGAYIASKKR